MYLLHSIIVNRIFTAGLFSDGESFDFEGSFVGNMDNEVRLLARINRKINSVYTLPAVYTIESPNAQAYPIVSELNVEIDIRKKSESFHAIQGIIEMNDLRRKGETSFYHFEFADDIFSGTLVFKKIPE